MKLIIGYSAIGIKFNVEKLKSYVDELILLIPAARESDFQTHYKYFDKVIAVESYSVEPIVSALSQLDLADTQLLTNDEAFMFMAEKIRKQLKLPGLKQKDIERFRDKVLMKQALKNTAIRLPKYLAINADDVKEVDQLVAKVERSLSYPLFIKPTDAAGSVNASKINHRHDLLQALGSIDLNHSQYEIDEFIEGTLYHCNAIIFGGEIAVEFISEYATPNATFCESKPICSIPIKKNHVDWKKLHDAHQEVIKAMQPPDGATHMEVFIDQNSDPVFLEIAARTPGALVPFTYQKMYGFDVELWHYLARLGHRPPELSQPKIGCFSVIIPTQEGILKACNPPKLKSKIEITWKVKPGQQLEQPTNIFFQRYTAGIAFIENLNDDELVHDFELCAKHQWLVVKPQDNVKR